MAVTGKDANDADVSFKTDVAGTITGTHAPVHIVESSALPTGAATAAHQVTQNTSFSTIITALGTLATAAGITSLIAAVTAVTAAIVARISVLGQQLAASSTSVVLASDHGPLPIAVDYTESQAWISKASNASTTDTIANTVLRDQNELWLGLNLPSGFSGTVTLEGSLDGGTTYFALPPDSAVVRGLVTTTVVLASNVITLANPVAAVNLIIPYDSPPPTVRVSLVRSSGGSATLGTYSGSYFTRAA